MWCFGHNKLLWLHRVLCHIILCHILLCYKLGLLRRSYKLGLLWFYENTHSFRLWDFKTSKLLKHTGLSSKLLKLLTGLSSKLRKITGLSSKLLKLLIEFSSYLLKMYWITSKTFIKNCNHYYLFKSPLIHSKMGGSVNCNPVNVP